MNFDITSEDQRFLLIGTKQQTARCVQQLSEGTTKQWVTDHEQQHVIGFDDAKREAWRDALAYGFFDIHG